MERVNKKGFIVLNLIIILIINWSLAAEFDYKNVDSWVQINQQCGGQWQSPVRIESTDFTDENDYDNNFSKINYHNKPLSTKLTNDGHTIKVEFEWDENQTPFLTGGFLGDDEYVLDSMHFHWSRNSSQGSEHIILGQGGVMEMHLVHYNRNYGSVKNSLDYNDGLTVIGGIFQISQQQNDPDMVQSSPAVSKILSNAGSVSTLGSSIDIDPFPISEVQSVQVSQITYIAYLGSLTTPPCTENVLWLLSTYPYFIDAEQLEFLQSTVEFNHGDDHNNRPVQPMNGRAVINLIGNSIM